MSPRHFGCGRTGSLAATTLTRMGGTSLALIGPDRVELHNLDTDGVGPQDIGQPEVNALADSLRPLRQNFSLHPCATYVTALDALPLLDQAQRCLALLPRPWHGHLAYDVLLGCVIESDELYRLLRECPRSSRTTQTLLEPLPAAYAFTDTQLSPITLTKCDLTSYRMSCAACCVLPLRAGPSTMRVLKVALAIVPSYKYIGPLLEAGLAYARRSPMMAPSPSATAWSSSR